MFDFIPERMWTWYHSPGCVISFHGNKSLIVSVKHQTFEPFSNLQDPLRSSDQEGPVSGEVFCCWMWKLDAIFVHVFKLASGCHGKWRGYVILTRWQLMWDHIFLYNISVSSLWCEIWPLVLWQQVECPAGSDILVLLVASFTSVANSNQDRRWSFVSWSCS